MKNRLLKTFTSLVLTVLMVLSIMPAFAITIGAAEETYTWTRVTSVDTLKAGGEFIIGYEADANSGEIIPMANTGTASTTKAGYMYSGKSASYGGKDTLNMSEYKGAGDEYIVTIAESTAKSGNITIHTAGGYIGNKNTQNNCKLFEKDSADNGTSFTATIGANDVITLKIKDNATYHTFQYNTGNPRFACYGGTQKNLVIYQRTVDSSASDCTHQNTSEVPKVPATCTEAGHEAGTYCNDCKTYISGGAEIPKTAHSFNENGVCTECPAKIPTYVKVTTDLTDWSGEYLIVYEGGKVAFDGSLTELDAVSNTVGVTITNSKITGDYSKNTFTIEKSGENYIIKSASGYYIGQTTDANELKSSTSAEYANAISLNTDGTVNFVSGGAYLRFNYASNQLRFRYYSSTSYEKQKAITLYKLADDSGSGSESTIPETEPTIKSFSLSLNKGVTVKVKINIPANWHYVDIAKVVFSNGNKDIITIDVLGGEHVYSVDLTPAQINDALTVKITSEDGSTIFLDEKDVSVRAYRDKAEAAGASEQLIALLDAALTYSNAADGKGENLENDFDGVADPTVVHKDDNAKLFEAFSGQLGTYASIYINVNTANVPDGETLVLTVGGTEIINGLQISNYITKDRQIVITGLFPANFDDTIYIAASTEGSNATFTFNSYLKAIYNDDSSTRQVKNLAVATYLYGLKAEAYLATPQ